MSVLLGLLLPFALVPQESAAKDFVVTISAPVLALEGEPWPVTVDVQAGSERASQVPLWAFTEAAFELAGKVEVERPEGTLQLAPGQKISTTLDLVALLATRGAEQPTQVELRHALADAPVTAQWLRRAETGIDFMTLPAEQLGDYNVVLQTTSGPIWLQLWPDVAPNHVRNFLDLANTGYYDGSRYHRVIPGFMVQSGRASEGRPAPRSVKAEFNTRRHVTGVLSAARAGNDIDSATSEFFLVHRPAPHLDGQYTGYGSIVPDHAPSFATLETLVKSVENNYAVVRELLRAFPIDPNHDLVQMVINTPRPPQEIVRAIVVKAPPKR
jgi:cyclophilin family peptidyl-prolyl cis-trans isomerase